MQSLAANLAHLPLKRAVWRAVSAIGQRCRRAWVKVFACLLCTAKLGGKRFNKPLAAAPRGALRFRRWVSGPLVDAMLLLAALSLILSAVVLVCS
jgi:hypothetical protein